VAAQFGLSQSHVRAAKPMSNNDIQHFLDFGRKFHPHRSG
jgi:hypothetical protein